MGEPHLRVAERCLKDDLEFDDEQVNELVKKDARDFKDAHKAIKKFVDMRGADPGGAEPMYGPFPRGLIGSLHVGSARGATLWDEDQNVCWLLAYEAYHRNGDPNDAFEIFISLYNQDKLLPTEKDYERLFTDDEDDFYDRLLAASEQLLERARANPGREEMSTWHRGRQVMCVDVLVEASGRAEEGWMGLTLDADEMLSDNEVFDLVQALIPPDVMPVPSMKFKDRDRRPGEIVYHWDFYEES